MSEQIGVCAGAVENYPALRFIDTVYEKPVRFNMTFPFTLVFSMQRMIFMLEKQRLFLYEHTHNIPKLRYIFFALLHQFEVFIKRTRNFIIKHRLQPQYFVQVIKGVMPVSRFLSSHHCIPFFNGGDSFGVKPKLAGYGVAVRGADRTFAFIVSYADAVSGIVCRKKAYFSPSRRYFGGHVNDQSVVSRNCNGLCNSHTENIRPFGPFVEGSSFFASFA